MSWGKPPTGLTSKSGQQGKAASHARRPSWNSGLSAARYAAEAPAPTPAAGPGSGSARPARVRCSSLDRQGYERLKKEPLPVSSVSDSHQSRSSNTGLVHHQRTTHRSAVKAHRSAARQVDVVSQSAASLDPVALSHKRSASRNTGSCAARSSHSETDLSSSHVNGSGSMYPAPGSGSTPPAPGSTHHQQHADAVRMKHRQVSRDGHGSGSDHHTHKRRSMPLRAPASSAASTLHFATTSHSPETGDVIASRPRAGPTSSTWDGTMGGDDNADRGGWLYAQADTSLADSSTAVADADVPLYGGSQRHGVDEHMPTGTLYAPTVGHTAAETPVLAALRQSHSSSSSSSQATNASTAAEGLRLRAAVQQNGRNAHSQERRTKVRSSRRDIDSDRDALGASRSGLEVTMDQVSDPAGQSLTGSKPFPTASREPSDVSGRGARIAELEKEVKALHGENSKLSAELQHMRELYENLTDISGTSPAGGDALAADYRRSNLLKSQVFQLERQVLLLSAALSKRASLVQECANTIEQVVNVLSHHQAESRKSAASTRKQDGVGAAGPVSGHAAHAVTIPNKEFGDLLHSACHTHARIVKGFEAGSASELDTALVFMSPFIKPSSSSASTSSQSSAPSLSSGRPATGIAAIGGDHGDGTRPPSLLDVCSGSLKHINLKQVGRLETELYQLYSELLKLQTLLRSSCVPASVTPTGAKQSRHGSGRPSSFSSTPGKHRVSSSSSSRADVLTPRLLNASDGRDRGQMSSAAGHTLDVSPSLSSNAHSKEGAAYVEREHPATTASQSSPAVLLASPFVETRCRKQLQSVCSLLSSSCDHLLGLSLLIPSAPFPALNSSDLPVADWSTDVVMAQLPTNIRNRREVITQLDTMLKAVRYSLMMKDEQVASMESELQFQRQHLELSTDYVQSYLLKISEMLSAFEDQVTASLVVPLSAVLEAYDGLQNSPSEDSLRVFVNVFKDNSAALYDAVQSVHSQPYDDTDLSEISSQFASSVATARQDHVQNWSSQMNVVK